MISRSTSRTATAPPGARSTAPWQRELASAITDPAELLARLELPASLLAGAFEAAGEFPLRVPLSFVERMRRGDPRDPLLLQVLPRDRESASPPGFTTDPLAEAEVAPVAGVLHKFRGRALLVAAGGCAINCRYCFRRHFPYAENRLSGERRRRALAYLAGEPSLREVILSGGDPLLLDDDRLGELARELAAIPHLVRLRVHSRLPVVLPSRVDERLVAWLAGTRLAPVMVLHANHPREIDAAVGAAISRLRAAGVTVLNQAVLLAGINDAADVLVELSEALFAAGALPYYLHLLDRVRGAAHFEVGEATARRLVAEAAARLPGYLVPRLVREVPGAPAKQPVC